MVLDIILSHFNFLLSYSFFGTCFMVISMNLFYFTGSSDECYKPRKLYFNQMGYFPSWTGQCYV
jgi:hypothetical protein